MFKKRTPMGVAAFAVSLVLLASCSNSGDGTSGSGTITIGGLFDLTGSNANVGTGVRNATQMEFDKVNAEGGVNGKKLKLVVQDEASDSAKAVTAYNYLRNQRRIDVMFGVTFTGAAVAVADIAQKQGVLLYSPSATSPVLTSPTKKHVFAANQTAAVSAKGIVSMLTSMGAKRIGLVEETDAYGAQGKDSLDAAIKEAGADITVAQDVKIAPDATDATSQITTLKGARLDAVVISVILNPAVAVIKAAHQQGLGVPIVSYGGGAGTAVDSLLTGDAPLEYYAPTPLACPLTGDCAKDLVAQYKEKFKEDPSVWSLQGYAATEHFVAALKKVDEVTPDKMVAALESMPPFKTPLIPVPMKFSPSNHLAIDETFFLGHKDGKLYFLGNKLTDNQL